MSRGKARPGEPGYGVAGHGPVRSGMGCKQRHAHSVSGHGEAYSFMWRGLARYGEARLGEARHGP